LSDAPVSYAFEQLEPSEAPPRDASARMLAQAREEAERIRGLARAEGYDEGRTNGLDLGAAEIASAAGAFAHAVQGIESLRTEVLDGLETDAIELGIALAGKILAGAFQARPELVVEVVQGALRRIADRRKITGGGHPADVEAGRAAIGGLTAQGSGVEVCDLQSDERVGAGSAIVRTAEGEVDASVQTQLQRASEVVSAMLESVEPAA
jgi:flagellar biosynthesis/type III secretory pathway protein FliH